MATLAERIAAAADAIEAGVADVAASIRNHPAAQDDPVLLAAADKLEAMAPVLAGLKSEEDAEDAGTPAP